MRFTAIEGWFPACRPRQDRHSMYSKPTDRARRPGRIAALALALVFSIGTAAYATPSPTPTFDPNNPEDAKLQAVFQRFDAKRDVIEGALQGVESNLIDIENRLVDLRSQLSK